MPRTLTTLILALAVMLLSATAVLADETAQVVELTATEAAEAQFLDLINEARAAVGVGELTVNDELTGIARDWSEAMHAADEMSHNPHYAEEYSGEGVLSENVGHFAWPAGELTEMVDILHQAFMDSAGHRRNIERERFNQVGIGVVHRDGDLWVTVNFLDGPFPAELHEVDSTADQGDDGTEDASSTDDGEEAAPVPSYHGRR